jgi:hypothetical protein
MRYLLTCLVFTAFIAGCKNDDKAATAAAPAPVVDSTSIQWLDSTKDFGTIQEGQKLEVSFHYKNTGDKPLVIQRVQPSCGCTVAEQSKEPVAPGAEGQIKAVFNSQGHVGMNHKTLYVFANTRNSPNSPVQFVVQVQKKN